MGLHSESGTMAVCESRKYRAKMKVKRRCSVYGETSLEIRRRRLDNIKFVMLQVHFIQHG